MKSTVSTKGQIVLPSEIRRQDGIEPGQMFEFERIGHGRYRLTKISTRGSKGFVDWLLSCPEKGYFKPIESESTDSL